MAGTGRGSTRKTLIVAGVVTLVVAVGAVLAVPSLLAAAETAPSARSTPDVSSTPVISATPIPEPTRAPVDWDALTDEQEAAIFEEEGPRGTALALVQEAFPDDFAYGYISDGGFGVGFKFGAPAGALGTLDAVGDPYEVHENVGFTEADIQPQVARVSQLVAAAVPQGQTFSVSANFFTATVEVGLLTGDGDGGEFAAPEGAALTALLTDLRAELYPGFDVEITSTSGQIQGL